MSRVDAPVARLKSTDVNAESRKPVPSWTCLYFSILPPQLSNSSQLMLVATNKRSRSTDLDNIREPSPKRACLSPIELLTPYSVPLSPTEAAIFSGQLDFTIVNERLL